MSDLNFTVPDKQITNRNYSYPTRYRFSLSRAPKSTFFANSASIPGISIALATQPTSLGRNIPQPGNKVSMDDFELRFIVDEDLTNYIEISKWIRGIGYPESLQQIYNLQTEDETDHTKYKDGLNLYSDGTLQVLNSNDRVTLQVRYYDLFPYTLTPLVFDATVQKPDPFLATVKFQYTYFDILDRNGRPL
jgi:hypothetical protein